MRDAGAAQRAAGRSRSRLLRLLAVVLAVLAVALGGQPVPAPRLETVSTQDPAPPASVVVTGTDRALAVTWTASAETATSGYQVFVDAETTPRVTTNAATRTATLTGLVNGREYTVTVRTVTSEVVFLFPTTYVGQASTPVRGTPRDTVAPAAPTGVMAARGDGRVDLTWTANGEPDVAGYRVLRDGAVLTTVTGTAYTDTAVVNDTTYGYALVAVDTSGNASGPSGAAAARPPDLTPPAVPAGFTAVRGDGQVSLSWTAGPEPDLAGHVLLRDGVEIATPAGSTYTDPGLANDSTYAYALVAVDAHGKRSGSATASATPTDLTPPPAPTGVTGVDTVTGAVVRLGRGRRRCGSTRSSSRPDRPLRPLRHDCGGAAGRHQRAHRPLPARPRRRHPGAARAGDRRRLRAPHHRPHRRDHSGRVRAAGGGHRRPGAGDDVAAADRGRRQPAARPLHQGPADRRRGRGPGLSAVVGGGG
ncbi:fibronectin type III domain-containing protein [Geodermatophilus sp. URMC 65]